MAERIIWYAVTLGCAALFFGIGLYARRRAEPMWFWAGSAVDRDAITDVKAYNRENGRMWMIYAIPFVVSAFVYEASVGAAAALLAVSGTAGIVWLIVEYNRIYKKYRAERD
ncbi:MAG: hypothetical protein ACI4XW_04580 [Candidatus Spyradocola sp.]